MFLLNGKIGSILLVSNFWTAPENFEYPDSPDLIGKLKVGNNLFFESNNPISANQIKEMLHTLIDYPNARFVKFDMPNLTASFSSTPEAEEYLVKLAGK